HPTRPQSPYGRGLIGQDRAPEPVAIRRSDGRRKRERRQVGWHARHVVVQECTESQYPALDITEFSTTTRTSANLENDTNGAAKGHALKQHLMTCTQQRRLAGRRRSARDREEAHGSEQADDVVQGWYVRLNAGSSCTRRR